MFICRLLQHRLPIEDGASGAGGGAAVRDARGAAKRGAGEPIFEENWGDRASLRAAPPSATLGLYETRPLPPHPPLLPSTHRATVAAARVSHLIHVLETRGSAAVPKTIVPRFFFNLYDDIVALDDEGLELRDLEAARNEAIRGVRSLAAEQVATGRLNLRHRVEIADGLGEILATVTFGEAIAIARD